MKMGKNLVIDTLEFWYHIDNQVSYRSVTYLSGSFNKKEREREREGGGGGVVLVFTTFVLLFQQFFLVTTLAGKRSFKAKQANYVSICYN